MLVLSLALVGSATISSLNTIGENTVSAHNGNGTVVCAQPANVTAPQPLSGYVRVQISVQTAENITHIVISRDSGNQLSVLVNATFSPRKYFTAFRRVMECRELTMSLFLKETFFRIFSSCFGSPVRLSRKGTTVKSNGLLSNRSEKLITFLLIPDIH